MKKFSFKNKANLKGLLFITGIFLIISGIWYSHRLIKTLENQATEYVHFRIKVFEANINNPQLDTNIDFLFNDVIRGADYPIIYSDTENNPQSWINISPKIDNKNLDDFTSGDSLLLFSYLKNMSEENPPIPIKYQNKIS